jgi:hypothetical protein
MAIIKVLLYGNKPVGRASGPASPKWRCIIPSWCAGLSSGGFREMQGSIQGCCLFTLKSRFGARGNPK